MVAKVIQGLTQFRELGLPDLRELPAEFRRENIPEIEQANSLEDAIALLERHIGFLDADMLTVTKITPIGTINIMRESLKHIVEKRLDARERYIHLALDTLKNPYEVWEAMYDDDLIRYLFIGTYSQKRQMLVVVAPWKGRVLWNFMHTDAKSLNKHRHGKIVYKRH
ncbi:PBECR2 nuclease fold domain-containing protein [Pantoea sp. C2G6]|uniref:PBECR2 nuclease fold domain-containing protein n=1 Tax=Pantoea sp. C2G6 TaxID=3243084 RepID=UPI003ED8F7DB